MRGLSSVNPAAKLVANLVVLLISASVSDPLTSLIIFIECALFAIFSRSITTRRLKASLPLVGFAVAMLWMNAAFARVDGGHTIASIWIFNFTDKGLATGWAIFFRILSIVVASILFISTTDANDLVLSLIQQCHLNSGVAYGILAAFRFFPLMKSDLNCIDEAHRIRSPRTRQKLLTKDAWYRRAIPLLAMNIRRAERVSVAMEARGFEMGAQRSYYRTICWKRSDTVFLLVICCVIAATLLVSSQMGWLVMFRRWQGF